MAERKVKQEFMSVRTEDNNDLGITAKHYHSLNEQHLTIYKCGVPHLLFHYVPTLGESDTQWIHFNYLTEAEDSADSTQHRKHRDTLKKKLYDFFKDEGFVIRFSYLQNNEKTLAGGKIRQDDKGWITNNTASILLDKLLRKIINGELTLTIDG